MANETVTTTIASLFPSEVVSRQVAESLQAHVAIAPHVWIETEEVSTVVKFGLLPTLTAAAFTEGTGMAFSTFSPTGVQVTCTNVGNTVRISGLASTLRPNVFMEVGEEQGKGIGAKIDTDLGLLIPSFTTNFGTSGAAITTANWLSAIAKLNANKVPSYDRVGFLSPTQYSDLLNTSQSTNSYAFQEAAKSGGIAPYFGIPVVMSQTLTTANAGVDNVGCIMQKRALGLGLVKSISTNIQIAPAQYNSTDVASVVYYGVALIDAIRGVRLTTKAT
jgi:hypothetical protein